MVDIHKIVRSYCGEYPEDAYSHSALARRVLKENPEIKMSHRNLRRLVSKERSGANGSEEVVGQASSTQLTYTGRRSLTSEQDAIDFFKVDLEKYEVVKFKCRSWDVTTREGKVYTNYYVALDLLPRKHPIDLEALNRKLDRAIKSVAVRSAPGSDVGVIGIADLHIGARITDIVGLEDFTYDIIIQKLREVADGINQRNFREVHICMLGDFIETFTGLNHPDSWKDLEDGGYGMRVVTMAYEILRDFLSQINNLTSINMVAGNHDRVTASNKEDTNGEAAYMISYLLNMTFPELKVRYDHLLLKLEIDNIVYLLTHMHYSIASKDYGKFMFKYGEQGKFNLVLGGHLHTRKVKTIEVKDRVLADEDTYRIVQLASIFTGNPYSLRNGWTSTSGYTVFSNNGKGHPNMDSKTI